MNVALKINSDKNEFHLVVFILVSHEVRIVNVFFDGAVKN
jgi:hypothetical protein